MTRKKKRFSSLCKWTANAFLIPASAGIFLCVFTAYAGAQEADPVDADQATGNPSDTSRTTPAKDNHEPATEPSKFDFPKLPDLPKMPKDFTKSAQVEFREQKTIGLMGTYGLYSLLVPSKKGAQLQWLKSAATTWEFDYFSGDFGLEKYGINLLSLQEQLLIIRYRHYWNNTFSLGLGLGQRSYSFELGSRVLDKIPGNITQKEKLIELTRYVFDINIGNRWYFNKGFVAGVDWIELSLPFGPAKREAKIVDRIEDDDDRKNTNKVLDYLNYFPTVTFFKLALGFAF